MGSFPAVVNAFDIIQVLLVAGAFAVSQTLVYFTMFQFLIMGRMRVLRLMQEMYMNSRAKLFLVLNNLDRRLDCVDQRITNDMDLAFQFSFEFLFGGLLTVEGGFIFNICLFIATTVAVLQDLADKGEKLDVDVSIWIPLVPTMAISFFMITLIPQLVISRKIGATQERQQQYEAEFRVSHARLRTYCEGIAFYGGADTERQNQRKHLYQSFHLQPLKLSGHSQNKPCSLNRSSTSLSTFT